MYDLNLDVNDFPKKAATLEGNHLLSHLNGSSDLQQIDLDLSPLSLGTFKSHLDLVNGWEDTNIVSSSNSTTSTTTASGVSATTKDIQRLHSTPSLSKVIRVRSPERCTSTGSDNLPQVPAQATAKSKEDASDLKNTTVGSNGAKSKKNKKQRQEQSASEQNSNKPTKAGSGNEAQKTNESKETASSGSKSGNKQPQLIADHQKNGPKKSEEGRPSKYATNGANGGPLSAQRGKSDPETRGGRCEQDSESKTQPAIPANGQQQQSKGKNKKSKNKGEKSNSAIGMEK